MTTPSPQPPVQQYRAEFRFYAELNEFLEGPRQGQTIDYRFRGFPGIKDPIEALGVPHTEVELIVVNGACVDFSYQLRDRDRVAVYPPFCAIDTYPLKRLRAPLAAPAFVLDVHLGRLARLLRLLGLDVRYSNAAEDTELVETAERECRALLTRDRRLLFHRRVTHGYFVRSTEAQRQAGEVIARYDLEPWIKPFSRCINCNGRLEAVEKHTILADLEPKTARYYDRFYRCRKCAQIYWKGSHFAGLTDTLRSLGFPAVFR